MRKLLLSVIVLLLLVGVAACAQREKPALPTPTLSAQPALPASATETPVVVPSPVATRAVPQATQAITSTTRVPVQATQPITSTTRVPTQPAATLPPNFIATAGPPPLATPTKGSVGPVVQPTSAPVVQPTAVPVTIPTSAPDTGVNTGSGACSNPYIVGRGEWAYQIARKCGTTFAALQAANPYTSLAVVYAGQKLNLPGGTGTPPDGGTSGGGRTYMVRPGDTLFGIAARFGTTAYAIQIANGLRNPNFIYVGQVLRIP